MKNFNEEMVMNEFKDHCELLDHMLEFKFFDKMFEDYGITDEGSEDFLNVMKFISAVGYYSGNRKFLIDFNSYLLQYQIKCKFRRFSLDEDEKFLKLMHHINDFYRLSKYTNFEDFDVMRFPTKCGKEDWCRDKPYPYSAYIDNRINKCYNIKRIYTPTIMEDRHTVLVCCAADPII